MYVYGIFRLIYLIKNALMIINCIIFIIYPFMLNLALHQLKHLRNMLFQYVVHYV